MTYMNPINPITTNMTQSTHDPMMLAFTKSLMQTQDGVRLAALNYASDLMERGFNEGEAREMMLAEEFDGRLTKASIDAVYHEGEDDDEDEEYMGPKFAMVAPTRYDDMAPLIDAALRRSTAKKFVALLTRGDYPIVRISEKNRQSLERIARAAKAQVNFRGHLHEMVRPFFEDALMNSVLIAEEQAKHRTRKIASTDKKGTYKVITAQRTKRRVGETRTAAQRTASCEVCLITGKCTCRKYDEGNYGEFGLPCEHLVAVADSVSPHDRLRRKISRAEQSEIEDDEE